MKCKKLKLCTLLLLGMGITGLKAQECLNASGNNASDSGGSVCYSIGQIVYTANTYAAGMVVQGVQQPYEISVATAIEETKNISSSLAVYPNPTACYLILEIKEFDLSNLSFQLYEMNGRLLYDEKIAGNRTSIIMSNLAPATYFLKIVQGNKEVKTYKIIKK